MFCSFTASLSQCSLTSLILKGNLICCEVKQIKSGCECFLITFISLFILKVCVYTLIESNHTFSFPSVILQIAETVTTALKCKKYNSSLTLYIHTELEMVPIDLFYQLKNNKCSVIFLLWENVPPPGGDICSVWTQQEGFNSLWSKQIQINI